MNRRLADRIAARILPPLDELGSRGTVVAPLLLVSLFSLLALAGIDPMLPGAFPGDPARLAWVRTWLRLLGFFAPVVALAKASVLGAAAWAVLVLLGAAPRFSAVLSALLYGEVVLALQGVWISFVLHLRAAGGTLDPAAFRVPSGLDAVAVPSSPMVAALLQGASAFHVAWMALLVLAFARCADTTRSRGAVAAATVWVLAVGVTVVRAAWA